MGSVNGDESTTVPMLKDSGSYYQKSGAVSRSQSRTLSKAGDEEWHVPKDNFKKKHEKRWRDLETGEKVQKTVRNVAIAGGLLLILFLFICSLSLLCQAFKLLSGKEIGQRIKHSKIIRNPVSASIVGMVVTLVLQSSTMLMSILVGMVAGRLLTVHQAIPIMMGSEMGASIMNALIALTQSGDRSQFRRAFAAATMNDIYNFLCFVILLPVEMAFSPIEKLSQLAVSPMSDVRSEKIKTLNYLTDPLLDMVVQIDHEGLHDAAISNETFDQNQSFVFRCLNTSECQYHHIFASTGMSDSVIGVILVVVSIAALVACMFSIVKILSYLFEGRIAVLLRKLMDKKLPYPFKWLTDYLLMAVGALIVVVIENSSVFRSALTPLVGIGVVTLEQLFPLIIGGNIGTTSTSTLAAFSADSDELKITLQMAFSQTIFNIFGLLLFYPIPFMRRIPIQMAMKLGNKTARYRWFSLVYIFTVFFMMPGFLLLISLLPTAAMFAVLSVLTVFLSSICVICFLQRKHPNALPQKLKTWDCLPPWLHSLKPYDRVMSKILDKIICKKKVEKTPEKMTNVADQVADRSAAKNLIQDDEPSADS